MRAFTTTELDRMQGAQEDAMMDTCQIKRRMETGVDQYGYPITTYIIVYDGKCGFDASPSKEVMAGTQVSIIDAVMRLPLDTLDDFDNLDRIKATYRFGEEVDEPHTFEIVGIPERGPSGLVLNLRVVTDGSD